MYIGQIPTPTATESRQEFTATSGQTQFQTTGGTENYADVFLNGVKLDSRSDFSFDGTTVTLTTGAAAGDVLAVVLRQADSALVALPIKDSAGNNVLSEANSVVTLTADEANVGSNALVVDSSGNVGIGRTSPNEKLEVYGVIRTNAPAAGSDLGTIAFGYEGGTVNAEISGVRVGSNAINDLIFSTANSGTLAERMRIDSSGNVKINNLGTGTVYSSSGTLTNTNPSDANLKENIIDIHYGLDEVKQLRPVEFDWIADEVDKHELGFIAQEVQPIIPDLVNTYERYNDETQETETGYGLESVQFIAVLTKAIQEQQSQIDALTARIETLEAAP